jgi:NADH-quinone oxidoreductase subunit L
MALWAGVGTLNIVELKEVGFYGKIGTVLSLTLFWSVMAKSAQFPLFSWLPGAMEGPTPVSALIHAATMVVAGIYLMVRIHWVFTPEAKDVFVIVGALTALIGALCALSQFDIKKILAYSTVSQLGFMVMAIGAGSSSSSMLHLGTHAFFKAALFLAAGAIIHSVQKVQFKLGTDVDIQDIRNVGGLRKSLPITFVIILIAAASLIGLPLTSGFLSKDAVLESLMNWSGNYSFRVVVFGVALLTSLITIL